MLTGEVLTLGDASSLVSFPEDDVCARAWRPGSEGHGLSLSSRHVSGSASACCPGRTGGRGPVPATCPENVPLQAAKPPVLPAERVPSGFLPSGAPGGVWAGVPTDWQDRFPYPLLARGGKRTQGDLGTVEAPRGTAA